MMLTDAERTVSDWLAEPRTRGSALPVLGPRRGGQDRTSQEDA